MSSGGSKHLKASRVSRNRLDRNLRLQLRQGTGSRHRKKGLPRTSNFVKARNITKFPTQPLAPPLCKRSPERAQRTPDHEPNARVARDTATPSPCQPSSPRFSTQPVPNWKQAVIYVASQLLHSKFKCVSPSFENAKGTGAGMGTPSIAQDRDSTPLDYASAAILRARSHSRAQGIAVRGCWASF